MKLLYSPTSPFVRKCLTAAHELKLHHQIELVKVAPNPVERDAAVVALNPLGQVPTLIADDGTVLHDSRVICEYLNALGHGSLIPRESSAHWRVAVEQSLADGITDAAVLARYETALRPENLRWADWTNGQLDKVRCGVAELERRVPAFAGRIDLATIATGCALGYLDFRYGWLDWRETCPALAAWFEVFSERPSMLATKPPGA